MDLNAVCVHFVHVANVSLDTITGQGCESGEETKEGIGAGRRARPRDAENHPIFPSRGLRPAPAKYEF